MQAMEIQEAKQIVGDWMDEAREAVAQAANRVGLPAAVEVPISVVENVEDYGRKYSMSEQLELVKVARVESPGGPSRKTFACPTHRGFARPHRRRMRRLAIAASSGRRSRSVKSALSFSEPSLKTSKRHRETGSSERSLCR